MCDLNMCEEEKCLTNYQANAGFISGLVRQGVLVLLVRENVVLRRSWFGVGVAVVPTDHHQTTGGHRRTDLDNNSPQNVTY